MEGRASKKGHWLDYFMKKRNKMMIKCMKNSGSKIALINAKRTTH
jgi:hypothetical protein